MSKKRKFIVLAVILTLMGIVIYGYNDIYVVEPFFSVLLSHPEAPIDRLCGKHHDPIRDTLIYTPIALDAQKRIYILGRKEGKTKILVLNQQGKIERTITPRLKGGRFSRWCSLFSVSPSGNHIWTVEWEGDGIHRVTVHDREGKYEADWLINRHATVHFLINTYSEHGAYVVAADFGAIFRFEIGEKEPQKFKIPPFYPTFFRDGRYWGTGELNWLIQQIGESGFKKQITKPEARGDLFGIATWSPREGIRLVSATIFPRRMNIQWIDEQGNFYDYRWGHYSVHLPSFLRKIPFLVRILKAFGISEDVSKPIPPKILIFSPDGKLLDIVPLHTIIRSKGGEKLRYGQLVKVDKTGIYLEVAKVNEIKEDWVAAIFPREYCILRIVKKPRWKVWWERLTKCRN